MFMCHFFTIFSKKRNTENYLTTFTCELDNLTIKEKKGRCDGKRHRSQKIGKPMPVEKGLQLFGIMRY